VTADERARKSRAVRDRLMALPEMASARTVMLFLGMDDEIDTLPVVESCLAAGKKVYSPRTLLAERKLLPLRIRDAGRLRVGNYNILEPDTEETCKPDEIDLILVPARAFDRRGNRLGRGAGFYDRFMASPGFCAVRVGIGYSCQVIDEVPHERHDLPVRIVVTDAETIRCKPNVAATGRGR